MAGRPEQLPRILFEIGKTIGGSRDLPAMMSRISELATELVGADATSIMLLDSQGERLMAKAAHGLRVGRLDGVSFAVGEGVAGWVVQRGEPARIDDVSQDDRFVPRDAPSTPIASMICVPLLAGGRPIGVMTATSQRTGAFDQADLEMLAFVAQTIALDVENARLRKLTVTDPLTGCYNREYLHMQLPARLREAEDHGTPLSVAMIDVDHFKDVNDAYGHAVGDRVLTVVADRLRAAIRGRDVLVRYGGEEFVALLPDTDLAAARDIGERMRAKLEENPVHAEGQSIDVRVSVGVARARPGESAQDVVGRADAAMYAAKRAGRNRVEVAP